jgi:nucleotide-binding universal stress UspA family protein
VDEEAHVFRTALLTVDGSEVSAAAVAQLPNVLSGDSHVLIVEVVDAVGHIFTQTTPAGFAYGGSGLSMSAIEALVAEQRTLASEHLQAAQTQLRNAGIRDVETRIVEGLPGPTIVDVAVESGVDVVVMATHGRSGLSPASLGSVTDYVVRHLAGIPVLLIRPEGETRRRVELQPPIVTAR